MGRAGGAFLIPESSESQQNRGAYRFWWMVLWKNWGLGVLMWPRTGKEVLMDCHRTTDLEGHLCLCLVKSQMEFWAKLSPADGSAGGCHRFGKQGSNTQWESQHSLRLQRRVLTPEMTLRKSLQKRTSTMVRNTKYKS